MALSTIKNDSAAIETACGNTGTDSSAVGSTRSKSSSV